MTGTSVPKATGQRLEAILRNVDGVQRRRMITHYWNAGRLDELDRELLEDSLDPEVRDRLGRIHPSFMGGEYLPERTGEEVTVLLIELASTLADVVELRARRIRSGKIRLQWYDEYECEFSPRWRDFKRPPSFRELTDLYQQTRQWNWPLWPYNFAIQIGPDSRCWNVEHFVHVSSQQCLQRAGFSGM